MVRHDGAGDVQHGELSEAGAEDVGVDLGQDHGLHTELPQLAACTGGTFGWETLDIVVTTLIEDTSQQACQLFIGDVGSNELYSLQACDHNQ